MSRPHPILAVLAFALALASCGSRTAARSTEGARRYSLRGQVVRFEESGKVAVIRHEKIDGWMDAMTMAFPLGDPRAASSLHAGDRVTATIFVKGEEYWVGDIHQVFAP